MPSMSMCAGASARAVQEGASGVEDRGEITAETSALRELWLASTPAAETPDQREQHGICVDADISRTSDNGGDR